MAKRVHCLPIVSALLVAACAAQTDVPDTTPVSGPPPAPAAIASAADIKPAEGGYKLTAEEQKLDCPKLTGQIKVRAMNMRAQFERPAGTATSGALQSVVTPVFGGSKRGSNKEADLAMDRAKLDAFNARLAEKNCKTVDIDGELRGAAPAKAPAPAAKPAQKATG